MNHTPSDAMHFRYSTKAFDNSKKVSDSDFAHIKQALQMSPSSTNIQPWHFVIADDEAGKARVAQATEGAYAFNKEKILNASHVIVFAGKVSADEALLNAVIEQEDRDGRYANPEFKTQVDSVRRLFVNMHRFQFKDEANWLAQQVYISLGMAMSACAQLRIDSVPIEGVDLAVLDETFSLRDKGYSALCVLAIGYRQADDFNAKLPKSRLPDDWVFSKA